MALLIAFVVIGCSMIWIGHLVSKSCCKNNGLYGTLLLANFLVFEIMLQFWSSQVQYVSARNNRFPKYTQDTALSPPNFDFPSLPNLLFIRI